MSREKREAFEAGAVWATAFYYHSFPNKADVTKEASRVYPPRKVTRVREVRIGNGVWRVRDGKLECRGANSGWDWSTYWSAPLSATTPENGTALLRDLLNNPTEVVEVDE